MENHDSTNWQTRMIRRGWRTTTRDYLRKHGYDLVRFTRMSVIENHAIDVVFDVGANVGQFGQQLRRLGYQGTIVSFEPVLVAYERLASAAQDDPDWHVVRAALGDVPGRLQMNVTKNSVSSSFLAQEALLAQVDPGSKVTVSEAVEVTTLDDVLDDYTTSSSSILLKIDTQGYERQVLAGAGTSMPRLKAVHFEVSLVPLYVGELLLPEALSIMGDHGFSLATLEPGLPDSKTGQLLQVDLTMVRSA